ncbi:medium-chain acyl-CoA ligase ACSF2, mitochondrial-like isoform X2 [Babylonia areolata]|uniref:medium-chain acyl-CoA ligase ACSF2, mitochondrial-like isoform X2 n=1 Tax=Babylonia areolata TaxID=304850 RepID=UPI003FD3AD15
MWGFRNSRFSSLVSWSRTRTGFQRDHTRSLTASAPKLSGQKLTLSYTHGVSDQPLLGTTVGRLLQDRVDTHPDRDAAVFYKDGQRLSFQQLLALADQLAAALLSLGLEKGDRVGIWGPNSVEWVITQFATARAGLILVNINPMYLQHELEFALMKVGCKALVAAPSFKQVDYYHLLFDLIPEMAACPDGKIHSHRLPHLKLLIMMGKDKVRGAFRFDDLLVAAGPQEVRAIADLQDSLQFDDPINIQFTSGTTGSPKGVTLSHHNIVNNSYSVGRVLDYDNRETRICCPVPLYHCFGMVLASLQMVCHGATVVYPSAAFDPAVTLHTVQDERCTSLYGVPTMFIQMLSHKDMETVNFSSLYTGVMGGSPCPIEVMRRVIDKMGMKEGTVCYGSTETSPVTFQTRRDCSLEKRVSTVGQVHNHVEAKVVGENGEVLPVGVTGEVCTRGYTSMLGYWDDHERTAECLTQDRWFHTGDQGVMDEDGYCHIVGRLKDMIIRGGENVYPVEIEQMLYHHPKVMEVQVVGVPDERMGEEICAWIQVNQGETVTETEIKDFCKEKIARFKIPRYIKFVESFPMTVTGKIQKFKIREQAIKDLALEHY